MLLRFAKHRNMLLFSLAYLLFLQGLLVLASTIPSSLVVSNLTANQNQIAPPDRSMLAGIPIDRYTECDALSIAATLDPGINSLTGEGLGIFLGCPDLQQAISSGAELIPPVNYFRFWHGNQVLIRPLLAVLPIDTVRAILWATGLILLVILIGFFQKQFGNGGIGLLVIALCSPLLIYQGSITTSVTLILVSGVPLMCYILFRRKLFGVFFGPGLVCFLSGVTYAFADFLIVPGAVWALTIFVIFVKDFSNTSVEYESKSIHTIFKFSFFFPAGYVFMYLIRWTLAAIDMGNEYVFGTVKGQLLFRISGELTDQDLSRYQQVFASFKSWVFMYPISRFAIILCLLIFLWTIGARHIQGVRRFVSLSSYPLGILVISLVALAQHAYIHKELWISINWAVAMGILLTSVIIASKNDIYQEESNECTKTETYRSPSVLE